MGVFVVVLLDKLGNNQKLHGILKRKSILKNGKHGWIMDILLITATVTVRINHVQLLIFLFHN
jgi:hypothetical protein